MPKQSIIKTNHGKDHEFILALHINDLVSIQKDGQSLFYRIQKIASGSNQLMFRLHTTSVIGDKSEELLLSVNDGLFDIWHLQKHSVNAIGKLIG